jgi:hypothetical protein
MWGEAPIDVTEVNEVFASYIEGKVSHYTLYHFTLNRYYQSQYTLLVVLYCTYWCYAAASYVRLLLHT